VTSVVVSFALRHEPLGESFVAPFGVILSEHDVVEPDVLFVSNERRAIVHGSVYGAPDLVIKVISPSSRRADQVTKRHLYDCFGVREYWVVDPELNTVLSASAPDPSASVSSRPLSETPDLSASPQPLSECVLLPGSRKTLTLQQSRNAACGGWRSCSAGIRHSDRGGRGTFQSSRGWGR
jgi:Uma2 family endonuclease